MNAFSVLAAAYGLVGAFSQVAAKVALNTRVRRMGLSTADCNMPSVWKLDKEASSDLIDIFTFAIISLSFLFAIFAEFTSYMDWSAGVISNLLVIVGLFVFLISTIVMESQSSRPTVEVALTWTLWFVRKGWLAFGLLILGLIFGPIYLLITVRPDYWFFAGLIIPQSVLAITIMVIVVRSPEIFKRSKADLSGFLP